MTGLQLALASGTLIGLGFALLAWRLAPSDPDLVDVMGRLSPDRVVRPGAAGPGGPTPDDLVEVPSLHDRIGVWALKNLPGRAWARTPHKDLAILQISETRFYGEKVVWALLGLSLPPLLATFFALIGLPFPVAIPTLGSLALACLFWFMPNYNATDDAKKARIDFDRALLSYMGMVAAGVRDGDSAQQALHNAADVADSWEFKRLERDLRRARYMGRAPWDTFHALSDELGVSELDDLADIMQGSGQDGAQIYDNLRAHITALRSALLSAEISKANAASERMYIPASLLGVVFMAILLAPQLLRFT